MDRGYFNKDQLAHMDALDAMSPEKRCYCGWHLLGDCITCPPGKTCADKLAERRKP